MRWRYATLMRPPGPGAVPRDGWVDCCFDEGCAPSGHHYWGWVEYNHPLTDKQVHDYELEFLACIEPLD